MSPDLINSIREQWSQCSINRQRILLDRYLNLEQPNSERSLVDFLAREFGVSTVPRNGAEQSNRDGSIS